MTNQLVAGRGNNFIHLPHTQCSKSMRSHQKKKKKPRMLQLRVPDRQIPCTPLWVDVRQSLCFFLEFTLEKIDSLITFLFVVGTFSDFHSCVWVANFIIWKVSEMPSPVCYKLLLTPACKGYQEQKVNTISCPCAVAWPRPPPPKRTQPSGKQQKQEQVAGEGGQRWWQGAAAGRCGGHFIRPHVSRMSIEFEAKASPRISDS